jgi:hypothetical protein
MSTLQQNWENRAEHVLLGNKGEGVIGKGWGAGRRDGPNNACTYE